MKLSEIPWIIVQSGGKGTRLQHLATNKPKCLLSVAGRPLLYRLFDLFPRSNFVVIGDYLYDVLEAYVSVISHGAPVTLVRAKGTGTISGLRDALSMLPSDRLPFLLVWGDLLLESAPSVEIDGSNLIGLSRSFPCRWSYSDETGIVEEPSSERGIAGFFVFQSRECLSAIPEEGEFVRWLAESRAEFDPVYLDNAFEMGTVAAVDEYQHMRAVSRFFNEVKLLDDRVVKQARAKEFEHLIEKELNWYRTAHSLGFRRIPALLNEHPMTLSRIMGRHPFELSGSMRERELVLEDIFEQLESLHKFGQIPCDESAMTSVYLDKTVERVAKISSLIPDIGRESIRVNGRLCRNPFHRIHQGWLAELVSRMRVDSFSLIHGDPTFSNTVVDDEGHAWFIDPRGYFGPLLLYGDATYDWAKLYYSVIGDYDTFNRRRFKLRLSPGSVAIEIESNGWRDLEAMFEDRFGTSMYSIRLAHALIWISLCGYVTDDYDSMLGAFYNGLLWLERADV